MLNFIFYNATITDRKINYPYTYSGAARMELFSSRPRKNLEKLFLESLSE